jgi:L-ascorbate metabolism protein UlaG (beta-lactamase superfamily)
VAISQVGGAITYLYNHDKQRPHLGLVVRRTPFAKVFKIKRQRSIVLALFVLALAFSATRIAAQEGGHLPPVLKEVVLKWLGNAGWEIRIGETVILIDPFITRGQANPGKEWKTDEEAVLKAINRTDYIFAGHSHADHIADVPFIARKFGSKVIGSRTTTNIALTGGVDKSRLITISGGEKLDFETFSVEVIESEHGALVRRGRKRRPKFEEITKPWSGPITGESFVEGGSYLYLFTFGKHRLLHQSTGGFIEDNLSGIQTDIALIYPMARDDAAVMLKLLQPKTVFVHHFDEWRLPYSEGLPESNLRRAQRFARDVNAIDKSINLIIPKFFESHRFD